MSFENTNRTFHREKCSRFKTFPTYGSDRNQSGLRFTDTRCGYTFTILLYLAILFFNNESYSVELLIYCAIWINRYNCKMDIEGTTISKGEEKKSRTKIKNWRAEFI